MGYPDLQAQEIRFLQTDILRLQGLGLGQQGPWAGARHGKFC